MDFMGLRRSIVKAVPVRRASSQSPPTMTIATVPIFPQFMRSDPARKDSPEKGPNEHRGYCENYQEGHRPPLATGAREAEIETASPAGRAGQVEHPKIKERNGGHEADHRQGELVNVPHRLRNGIIPCPRWRAPKR